LIGRVVEQHPQVKVLATTLREARSAKRHSWSAAAWMNGQTYSAPTAQLEVYDRVGGGDGFASGLFYGFLSYERPDEALKLGWADGTAYHLLRDDTTMATLEQVRALAQVASARIRR
jgi:2-dehydro-3-deoxygluconokinase